MPPRVVAHVVTRRQPICGEFQRMTHLNARLHARIAVATRNEYVAENALRLYNHARRLSYFVSLLEQDFIPDLHETQAMINARLAGKLFARTHSDSLPGWQPCRDAVRTCNLSHMRRGARLEPGARHSAYCAQDMGVGRTRCTLIAERSISSPTLGLIVFFQKSLS